MKAEQFLFLFLKKNQSTNLVLIDWARSLRQLPRKPKTQPNSTYTILGNSRILVKIKGPLSQKTPETTKFNQGPLISHAGNLACENNRPIMVSNFEFNGSASTNFDKSTSSRRFGFCGGICSSVVFGFGTEADRRLWLRGLGLFWDQKRFNGLTTHM